MYLHGESNTNPNIILYATSEKWPLLQWNGCTHVVFFFTLETVSAFIVMWTTFTPSSESVVKYGLAESALTSNVSGKMVEFNDSKKLRYIHSVELTGLKPGTKYCKFVGNQTSC